ncbi:TadE/TadG family type IV pilus assembly protein [Streptomyces sp. CA-135486]|uniref:TadE/TadG family type IV pilus assembly protein n=1 Tax=Streptomyces sp. CA-135486 TaxID=3240049 RepID=UPI003D89F0FC
MRKQAARRDDRGQAVIEYGGWLVMLLFVALVAVQVGLAVYAAQQAGTAARAAARVASQHQPRISYQQAGRESVSSWLQASFTESSAGDDEVTVEATVTVPSLVPGFDFTTTKSATMPRD